MYRIPSLAVLLVALVGLTACESTSAPETEDAKLSDVLAEPVEVVESVHGAHGGPEFKGARLATTPEQLKAMGEAGESLGEVDFGQHSVVVVSLGEQPTTGYWARIDSVALQGETLIVSYTANKPAEAAGQALTQPFAAAVVAVTGVTEVVENPTQVTGEDF